MIRKKIICYAKKSRTPLKYYHRVVFVLFYRVNNYYKHYTGTLIFQDEQLDNESLGKMGKQLTAILKNIILTNSWKSQLNRQNKTKNKQVGC